MREADATGLVHPEWINGMPVWTDDDSVGRLVDKLQKGDPSRGWEGDPRLVVAYNKPADQWEVWRREHDDQYRLVARKPPGSPLDDRIIDHLIAHDTRRGFDVGRHVIEHNERLRREKRNVALEEVAAGWDKLKFYARKELR